MYGLPKVHKDPVPMRSIVSQLGPPATTWPRNWPEFWPPHGQEILPSEELNRLCPQNTRCTCFPGRPAYQFWCCQSLCTGPSKRSPLCTGRLNEDQTLKERTSIPVTQVIYTPDRTMVALYVFQFENHRNEQTGGVAMGSSPPSLPHCSWNTSRRRPSAPFKPYMWTRYVDDTFVTRPHGPKLLQRFHEH